MWEADVNIVATKKDGVGFRDNTLEKLAVHYKDLASKYVAYKYIYIEPTWSYCNTIVRLVYSKRLPDSSLDGI